MPAKWGKLQVIRRVADGCVLMRNSRGEGVVTEQTLSTCITDVAHMYHVAQERPTATNKHRV
jgi:hypothetical protein